MYSYMQIAQFYMIYVHHTDFIRKLMIKNVWPNAFQNLFNFEQHCMCKELISSSISLKSIE